MITSEILQRLAALDLSREALQAVLSIISDIQKGYEKNREEARQRTAKWRLRRHGDVTKENPDISTITLRHRNSHDPFIKERKINGANAPPISLEKQYFDRCVEVLGPRGRSLGAKLLASKGRDFALARSALETASTKASPQEYIGAIVRKQEPEFMAGIL